MVDALVKVLNRAGYVPVFLPRTDLRPPELYNFAEHRLRRRGPLLPYLPSGTTLRPNHTGAVADITHHETSKKSISAATSFLEKALRCIGIDAPLSLNLSFASGGDITFAFTDVTFEATDGLDQVLTNLEAAALPDEYVKAGRLHVAYEYLYAKAVVMRWSAVKDASGAVNGPEIAELVKVGGEASVQVTSETSLTFTSKDNRRVAFAYKAGRLQVTKDKRWAFYPEELMRGFNDGDGQPYLPASGVVLVAEEG